MGAIAFEHTPDYRTVALYWTAADAEIARAMLHSDGIPAAYVQTADSPLLPGVSSSPVRLLVPADELDRAQGMLGGRPFAATRQATTRFEAPAVQAGPWSPWFAVTTLALAGMGALAAFAL